MWGNIVAPMVIGFAADKLMGGSGVKGAVAGGTMGYGAGKPGAVPGVSNIPAHLISDPTIAATAIPGGGGAIHTAAGARGIPSNTGNITGLFDNWSNPIDFIKDGFSDMTFADQLGVGLQAEGLLNRPTRRDQYPDIQQLDSKQFNQGNKYETQIQDGIPITTEPEITEEDLIRLRYPRYKT